MVQNQISARIKRFENILTKESPLLEVCVGIIKRNLLASLFQFCKAATHVGSPECFTSQITCQAQYVHATKFSLWSAQLRSVQSNISKFTLHRLVDVIALRSGKQFQKTPANYYILLPCVTNISGHILVLMVVLKW